MATIAALRNLFRESGEGRRRIGRWMKLESVAHVAKRTTRPRSSHDTQNGSNRLRRLVLGSARHAADTQSSVGCSDKAADSYT